MPFTHNRRTFMSVFTSLAGVAAVQSAVAAQAPAGPTDLSWLDAFRGRHKQLYDYGWVDLAADPLPPLRFPRNYLNSVRDVTKLEFPDVNTAVGISVPAFPMNASDKIWQEYGLGERSKIIDPTTKKPAVRNVFLDGGEFSVKALQARGTVFWQCQVRAGLRGGATRTEHGPASRRGSREPDRRAEPRRTSRSVAHDGTGGRTGAGLHLRADLSPRSAWIRTRPRRQRQRPVPPRRRQGTRASPRQAAWRS